MKIHSEFLELQATCIAKAVGTFLELSIANALEVWDIYILNSDRIRKLVLKVRGVEQACHRFGAPGHCDA
jgi:hypothetical protein